MKEKNKIEKKKKNKIEKLCGFWAKKDTREAGQEVGAMIHSYKPMVRPL